MIIKIDKSSILVLFLLIILILNPLIGFAEDSDNYSIQMGLFSDETNAQKLVEKINTSGFNGFYIKESKYRVYAGIFSDKESATNLLSKAKSIVKGAYVVKINSSLIPTENMKIEQNLLNVPKDGNENENKDADEDEIKNKDDIELDGIKAYNQLLGNNVLLQGVYGQSSFYFTIDPSWKLKDSNYFDLYYQHSFTGVNRGSSITLELNGTPIESFFIDMLDGTEHYLRIQLPKNLMSIGFNELKIKSYHRISDLVCEDDGNPANWVTIFGRSYMHLEYDDTIENIDLSNYPYPYIKSYMDKPFNAQFLFSNSDKPSEAIVKTAMTIAADTGRRVKFKNTDLTFGEIDNISSNQNYIFMGTKLPSELAKFFNLKSIDDMYIAQGSIGRDHKILALISKDEDYLPLLANGLVNDIWLNQLQGDYVSFSPEDLIFEYDVSSKDSFTLSELGYASSTMMGAKTSSSQYFLEMPDNWTLEKEASIILKVRYSKVIDFSNSSISVVINGVPVGSNTLTEDGADGDIISFKIPSELKNSKTLAISVNLYLDGDFDCQDGSVNTNYWLFVSNESSIYLPHVPKIKYNLFHYPAPFVSDFKMDMMNIVLDKNYSLSDVEMALNIIAYASHEIKHVNVPSLTLGKTLPEHHNIIIGSLDSDLMSFSMNDFNIQYLYSKKQFESTDKRRLINPFNNNLSTIQLIQHNDSPYLDLYVAYQGDNNYRWIAPYLSDLGFTSKLGGNTVFVDQNGYYQVFDTEEVIEQTEINLISEVDTSQPKRVSYESSRNFLIFLALLLIVVVVIIIFIASKSRHKI